MHEKSKHITASHVAGHVSKFGPCLLAVRALLNLVVQTSTAGPLSFPLLA
jgi:hypothetical protein